jgi:hypothetical protein
MKKESVRMMIVFNDIIMCRVLLVLLEWEGNVIICHSR